LYTISGFLYRNRMSKSKKAVSAPPKERSEALTDHLLDVAGKFFLEKGFEGASVSQIARHAHASKETFYSRFPNKEELFRAVIRRRTDIMAAELGTVLVPHALPAKALTSFGEFMLDLVLSEETIALRRTLSMQWRQFPELTRIFYELGPARTIGSLAKYLEEQVSHGRLRKLNSQIAARQFMDLLAAEMVMRASLGIFPKPTRNEKRRKVKNTVEFFLRGYGV
jgi:TetR/AcrR family transcriptional regulator, mexJK operon transcriptional repressor